MARSEDTPVVEITLLDGRPRRLVATLGTLKRLKQVAGAEALTADLSSTESVVELLGPVIWSLMVSEDREDLTVADIEDLIPFGRMEEIGKAAFGLMVDSMPEMAEGKAPAEPRRPARAKGKRPA